MAVPDTGTRPSLSSVRPILLSIVLAVTASALLAVPAGAHAEIRDSGPERGGVAPVGLEELSMTFISLDPAGPLAVEVTDEAGTDVVAGEPQVSARDSVVTVPVEPLDPGDYTVRWRAMSDDGDGVSEGSFGFTAESADGGVGTWLVWAVALLIPAAIFLRPGRWRGRGRSVS